MALRVVVGVGIQVEPDDREAVPLVKRDRVFVAGLRLQNDHPRSGILCGLLDGPHQACAKALAARGFVKNADVADAIALVPALRGALHIAEPNNRHDLKEQQRLYFQTARWLLTIRSVSLSGHLLNGSCRYN